MTTELKPCPFCGGLPISEYDSDWGTVVKCASCGGMMVERPYLHVYESGVVKAWNTRAGEEKIGCTMEREDNGSEVEPDWVCSHCGDVVIRSWVCPNYCPNCGAEVVIDKSASLQFEVEQ